MRSSLTSLEDSNNVTLRLPLWDRASAEFCFAKSRELLTKPFPKAESTNTKTRHSVQRVASAPHNSCRDIPSLKEPLLNNKYINQQNLEQKLMGLSLDDAHRYQCTQYRDRTLTKSDSMQRKSYNYGHKIHKPFPEAIKLERNRSFLHDTGKYLCSPVTSPPYWAAENIYSENYNYSNFKPHPSYKTNSKIYTEQDNFGFDTNFAPIGYEIPNQFSYENGGSFPQDINTYHLTNSIPENSITITRPRALSFSDTRVEAPKKMGKSVRDRNLRRQSYNPRTYESSSSESECASLGSAVHSDLELRRRRKTSSSAASRLSTSNSSIRSELITQGGRIRCGRIRSNNYLKPDISGVAKMGKSPPPSQSVLSGLSPTTVARWQHDSNSSSDSSL